MPARRLSVRHGPNTNKAVPNKMIQKWRLSQIVLLARPSMIYSQQSGQLIHSWSLEKYNPPSNNNWHISSDSKGWSFMQGSVCMCRPGRLKMTLYRCDTKDEKSKLKKWRTTSCTLLLMCITALCVSESSAVSVNTTALFWVSPCCRVTALCVRESKLMTECMSVNASTTYVYNCVSVYVCLG